MPPTSRRCGRCWLPRGSQRPWPSRCWACRCAGGISTAASVRAWWKR
jgi:hypothetical protein